MSKLTTQVKINEPVDKVWEVLADAPKLVSQCLPAPRPPLASVVEQAFETGGARLSGSNDSRRAQATVL